MITFLRTIDLSTQDCQCLLVLVVHAVMLLNCYPDQQGVSGEYSPRERMLKWQLRSKHLKHGDAIENANFGQREAEAL